jgi:LDH2 family malate/lactate/ureidoglycolate dehydrogenase
VSAAPRESHPDAHVRLFPAAVVESQISAVLAGLGMPPDLGVRTARIMVDADVRGIDSHGISMLPMYESKVAAGGLRLDATPEVVTDAGGAVAVLDARNGLGHVVSADAMTLACDKADQFGIGLATVRNSHHFGAAGYYARAAARRGMVALVLSSSKTLAQAPAGGIERVLGTNPLAIAAPSARHEPLVLDMSTSLVALDKVKTYALQGKDLPAAWVADADGQPIHDSTEALRVLRQETYGGLLPLGGASTDTGAHKGYGLSLMVQVLSCALAGAGLPGSGVPDNIGHTFVAISPLHFGTEAPAGAGVAAYVDELIDRMHATTPHDPDRPVQVAGEPEDRALAERGRDGIPIPATLRSQLHDLCQRHDAAYLLGT